jgi:hypothetical protein
MSRRDWFAAVFAHIAAVFAHIVGGLGASPVSRRSESAAAPSKAVPFANPHPATLTYNSYSLPWPSLSVTTFVYDLPPARTR